MADQGPQGIERIIKAFGYSLKGFKAAYRYEAAFRQELALSIIMVPLGFWLGQTPIEQVLLVGVVLMVLVVELLNTAVEAVVDRIGSEHHELAGRAKDIGSAAVFLSLTTVVIVWGVILQPYFLPLD
ncbi:MAG: diacylglycerol kinase [Gammaproteobacteria bacterium]|nr:diacylglycerol kinase [Gammaproteobacteria bacterium]